MKINRVIVAKCLVTIGLLLSTGIPFICFKKVYLPSQVNIAVWFLVSFSFLILWRDFIHLHKNWSSWVLTISILILVLARKCFLPCHLRIYDILFISLAFSFIFHPSGIKDLLIFTSCLITPLSIAALYGVAPSMFLSLILIVLGIISAVFLPKLKFFNFVNKPSSFDFILYFLLVVFLGVLSFRLLSFCNGPSKNRKIVFDIGHGSTESPLLDYNPRMNTSEAFGHARLVKFLEMYHFPADFVHEITAGSLSDSSILVLIMSSLPYTYNEIKVIKEFVSRGGSLLVIGDHTDISNVLSSLNPVIEQFGIRLRFDTIWLQTNERINLWYSRHPALIGLEKVNFSVGASLDIEPPARPVILSRYSTYSDLGDPNKAMNAYIGNSRLDPGERIHDLCLVAESLYGKGKVFVLGDSAYFQNASLYQNYTFAYRLFDWLNHCNDDLPKRNVFPVIILICIILLLALVIHRKTVSSSLLAALVISLLFSLWLSGLLTAKRPPMPQKFFNTILLDMAHQNEYTLYWLSRQNINTGLEGLMGQIIRVGFDPIIGSEGRLTDEIFDHKAYFVISPNKAFSEKEIEVIAQYVENGGGLLLVEGARKWAISQDLWERFGLYKDRHPLSAQKPILSPVGLPLRLFYGNFKATFIPMPITYGVSQIRMVNPCAVRGGLPIAFIDNIPVINFKEFGKGRIIAIGDDRFFANYLTEFEGKVIDFDKLRLIWNIIGYLTNAKPN